MIQHEDLVRNIIHKVLIFVANRNLYFSTIKTDTRFLKYISSQQIHSKDQGNTEVGQYCTRHKQKKRLHVFMDCTEILSNDPIHVKRFRFLFLPIKYGCKNK